MYSDVNFDENPLCESCKADKVQRKPSNFGFLAMYCLWWFGGFGLVIFKLTLFDYCENCYYINFMKKSRPKRMFSLVVDDKSQLEMPPVDAAEVKKKFDENLLQKI
ncbi:LITAF domain-containing protein [Caenorhabditis elegans]|uniref:LITAF domain-containing protein n=1 Tax=Caenorhabditis elegans TaxID=6239 RepID=Q21497_CAEEL|nr:LITAF domain-containing protein [Caenorhabditis elegans]CCD68246.1 LITAF domain-containing protein [Caenorhabditis elegans]|eukprot:NP_504482.2 Uncharacterized protein CELE_M03E7.3 [Caenorhabditis elegans]